MAGTLLWRWRRNPLRRRTDLVQAWIAVGLFLAVLTATPAAGVLVGDAARRHMEQTARHQADTRHRTTAVLVHDAPVIPSPGRSRRRRPCTRSLSASPTATGTPAPRKRTSNPP
ncbi:hypothetical protein ACFQ0X_15345 [Streptomyces rectiviolaceus]|uniref:Rv1733c family protein n=1 Tax=Streptomyces rectiviolaceus TaxID=332591 RepID=UPI00362D1A86